MRFVSTVNEDLALKCMQSRHTVARVSPYAVVILEDVGDPVAKFRVPPGEHVAPSMLSQDGCYVEVLGQLHNDLIALRCGVSYTEQNGLPVH